MSYKNKTFTSPRFKMAILSAVATIFMSCSTKAAVTESPNITQQETPSILQDTMPNSSAITFERTPDTEVFKIVEQMPRFPGCEEMAGSEKEKEDCAKNKMLEYIYGNLKYPEEALKNDVEGMAVVHFIVTKEGYIANVELIRDPGSGTGQAAIDVVNTMNDLPERWTPGKQRGVAKHVLYTLPVRFKLSEDLFKQSGK